MSGRPLGYSAIFEAGPTSALTEFRFTEFPDAGSSWRLLHLARPAALAATPFLRVTAKRSRTDTRIRLTGATVATAQ